MSTTARNVSQLSLEVKPGLPHPSSHTAPTWSQPRRFQRVYIKHCAEVPNLPVRPHGTGQSCVGLTPQVRKWKSHVLSVGQLGAVPTLRNGGCLSLHQSWKYIHSHFLPSYPASSHFLRWQLIYKTEEKRDIWQPFSKKWKVFLE